MLFVIGNQGNFIEPAPSILKTHPKGEMTVAVFRVAGTRRVPFADCDLIRKGGDNLFVWFPAYGTRRVPATILATVASL